MQDIDAAYLFGASGDLDADLSALLEVPDMTLSQPGLTLGPGPTMPRSGEALSAVPHSGSSSTAIASMVC